MISKERAPIYDQTLKRLLTQAHDAVLRLIAPTMHWRAERSPELPASNRQADLVWEVEGSDGRRGLLHIELQVKVEANIRERLLEYSVRLMRRDHLPVHSVVVFLRKARRTPASPLIVDWNGQEVLRYSFDVVRLWEIPARQVLEMEDSTLWPLPSLMAGVTHTTIVDVAARIAAEPRPVHERGDLTGALAVLAGLRFSRAAVVEMIRSTPMISDILRESNILDVLREVFGDEIKEEIARTGRQAGIQEGRQTGIQEGRQAGIQEGRQVGIQEGKRELARMALENRFGPPAADVVEALHAADEATLLAVVMHIATDTPEQLRARLGLA